MTNREEINHRKEQPLGQGLEVGLCCPLVHNEILKSAAGTHPFCIGLANDPDLTALTFMAIHQGVLYQWSLNRYQLDGRKYVKNYRRVIMNGLKA